VVNSLDDVKAIAKSKEVCQHRTSNLKDQTKYSFKCSHYRKYPLCRYELKSTVPDADANSITVMFKSTDDHDYRNQTRRLASPLRQLVSKYISVGLRTAQIRSSILIDYPTTPIASTKLTSLVQIQRRKGCPEMFSIYDFLKWCNYHQDDTPSHSTYVPFYYINDIYDLFVLFSTKTLIQQITLTELLQVDATYKIT
ncbi:unnamed protein product, partial [Rotaria sp. Silwood2]